MSKKELELIEILKIEHRQLSSGFSWEILINCYTYKNQTRKAKSVPFSFVSFFLMKNSINKVQRLVTTKKLNTDLSHSSIGFHPYYWLPKGKSESSP